MNKKIHLEGDFFSRLSASQPSLKPKMARIAAYVSEHYTQAAFMSTTELAAAAEVSLATVVRFPTLLGYENFRALRNALQERINFDLTGVERLSSLPSNQRTPSALLHKIIESDLESLRTLLQANPEPQLEKFAGSIQAAQRIYILGFRFLSPLAAYFEYALSKVRPHVQAFTQADSTLYDRFRLLEPNDLVIVLAVARYPADLLALARYVRSLNIRILAITDSPISPFVPLAETVLFAKSSMLDFVGSLAAPAALVNCIVSELGVRLGQSALNRLQALEEAAQSSGIYVPGGRSQKPKVSGG